MAIKGKSPWKRRRRRILFHGGILLVCFLIVLAVVLFTPFTSDLLDAKIVRAFEQATGLRLSFDSATYWLGRGRMTLSEIRIEVPETGQRITGIHQMVLQWKWRLWEPADPFDLRRIEIAAPEPVVFYLEKNLTLTPQSGAQSFLDFMKGLERSSATASKLQPVRTPVKILIRNFALYLEEKPEIELTSPTLPAGRPPARRLAGMESMELEMQYNGITIWPLTISGRLWGRPAAPFAMTLKGGADNREFRFSAELETFDLAGNLQKPLPLLLRGDRIVVNGRLLSGEPPGTNDVEVSVKAHDLTTSFTRAGLALPCTDLECRTFATLDHTSRTITLKNAELQACKSSITGGGKFELDDARNFSVEIASSSLVPEILNPLARLLPENLPSMPVSGGRLQLRGRVSGNSSGIDWPACQGDAQASALVFENVPLGEKPTRVGPIEMDARLTSAALEIPRLSVQVLSNNLTLSSARIARRMEENQKGREVRANWNLEAKVQEAVGFLPSKESRQIRDWKPKGQVRGNGTIRGEWPRQALLEDKPRQKRTGGLRQETGATEKKEPAAYSLQPAAYSLQPAASDLTRLEAVLERLKLDGLLQLEGFYLDPEFFPAPLENGAGTLFLSGQAIRLSSVTAGMLGSSLSLEGQVTGTPFVWSRPEADLRLRGDLDLAQAPRWVTPEMMRNEKRALIKRMAPSGKAALDLDLSGPLLDPGKLTLKGAVIPTSVSLTLDTTSPTIRFSGIEGKIQLAFPTEIRLDPLRMNIQAQGAARPAQLTVSGPVSNTGLDLNWQTSGDLPHYKQLLPYILDYFQVGGPVTLSGRTQANLKPPSGDSPPLPATLAGAAGYLRKEFLAQEDSLAGLVRLNQIVDWDFKTLVEANDCEFTHISMPSRITHVRGRFQIGRDGLRSISPVRAQWGATDGFTEGWVRLTPEGVLRIDFSTSAPLMVVDDWAQRWGPRNRPPRADEAAELPEFDPAQKDNLPVRVLIDGTLKGQRATFRRFPLENASAHFQFRDYKGPGSFLEFDRIEAGLFGGAFRMHPWLFSRGPRFRWNVDLEMDDVNCERLLESHYGHKPTVTGLLSTRMSLRGVSTKNRTMEGSGAFALKNSRFMGNPIFLALGKLLDSKELEDISFTRMESTFSIKNKDVAISQLSLSGSLMELEAQGTATTDGALDLDVVYRFLKFLPKFPVLKEVVRFVENMGSWLIKAHVGGTLQQPQITTIVPASMDKLPWPPFSRKNEKDKAKDLTLGERATSPTLSVPPGK